MRRTKRSNEGIKRYEKAGFPDRCQVVEAPYGHYWDENAVWGAIEEEKN